MRTKAVSVAVVLSATTAMLVVYMYRTNKQVVMAVESNQRADDKYDKKIIMLSDADVQSLPNDNADLLFLRKYGKVDKIPSIQNLSDAPVDQLISIYHSYLDNINYLCRRKLRMGNLGDGGWEICDDFDFRPIKPCIIYSFGINNDFSFDDDAGKVYGCQVLAFDPSMDTKSHQRSDRVYFHQIGIRGENNDLGKSKNWKMETFSGIRRMLDHVNKTIDVVKMDVEDSEWDTLTLMAREGQFANVRQLLVEYHFGSNNADRRALNLRLNVIREMEDQGLRRFYVHKNPACPRHVNRFPVIRTVCYEIHYVNVNFRRPAYPQI